MFQLINNIKNGNYKNIIILTGAGISTSSGIPDFRSSGGLYDTLKPELLTATNQQKESMKYNPTDVVSISLFQYNQFPYLEVRKPFILGTFEKKWKPTLSHYFIRLLHDKNLLRRLYTQNIDGLHSYTGLPSEKLVSVHGSLNEINCEFCGHSYPVEKFNHELKTKIRNIYDPNDTSSPAESTNILCENCQRPGVKPNTVLYGCSLPDKFFQCCSDDFSSNCDLLIVAGTSLVVGPANQLVRYASSTTPRLIVNVEPVGHELGIRYNLENEPDNRDFFLRGSCDEQFLQLCIELDWVNDLKLYRDEMCEQSQQLLDRI